MQAKSIKGNSAEEIRAALNDSLAGNFRPTLAIVFMSVMQDRKAVTELLKQKDMDIFGATSCGEFINGHQSEGETAILLLDLPRENYSLIIREIGNSSVQEAATVLAEEALQQFANPSLILCSTCFYNDGEYLDGISLVSTIETAIGPEKIFFGGMAGDDGTFTGSYVFTGAYETRHGLAAIVLNADKISLTGMAITGWKPMGITRKVTKSSGNLLYEIDGKPAVEMYLKYLGKSERTDDKEFNVLHELAFHYPFIADRGDGETIIKSPMRIDYEENALITDMEMPEGSVFRFSTPPDFEIVEEVIEEAAALKNAANLDADALLIFSCAGRHPALGPLVTTENEGLADVWQTPMAGFFTYGEFGRTKKGKQYFHSTACCWVALKELYPAEG